MNADLGLERCRTFINCQLQPPAQSGSFPHGGIRRPVITLSRQTGCGAHAIAERLVALLQTPESSAECPWTVFDRNLVEKVLADHRLPARLARFMAEDRISEISDTLDELFGLHPSSWTLVHKAADTILHLAEIGHVILIGRGANVITASLPNVLHIRLVAPLGMRIAAVQQAYHLTTKAAAEQVRQEDLGRSRYLKKYFDKEIEDALLYHLVINTGLLSQDQTARLIVQVLAQTCGQIAAENPVPLHASAA